MGDERAFRARLLGRQPLQLSHWLQMLERDYPELAALQRVAAEPGEGAGGQTAFEHTQAVLDAVRPQLKDLPVEEGRALYLAALLHEVGRGPATRAGTTSAGHERAGATRGRDILFRLQVPPGVRDEAVYLVRRHTLPLRFDRRPPPDTRILRLAWALNTRLLYLLAAADCRAGPRPEAACAPVAAFRARCEGMDLFGREPPSLIAAERWAELAPADPQLRRRVAGELRFWRLKGAVNTPAQAEAWLRQQEPAPAGTLYLPVGVPGSGKTTWVQRVLEEARLVSMDEMREALLGDRGDQSQNRQVYMRCRSALGRALRDGETAVWDAQSHTWSARQSLLTLAREAHAYVIIVYFDVPLAVALARNLRRAAVVPEQVIRRSYRDLEEPRPFEAEEMWRIDADGKCTRQRWSEAAGP